MIQKVMWILSFLMAHLLMFSYMEIWHLVHCIEQSFPVELLVCTFAVVNLLEKAVEQIQAVVAVVQQTSPTA